MTTKLPQLLAAASRIAALAELAPGTFFAQWARQFLWDLLPQALIIFGRAQDVTSTLAAARLPPASTLTRIRATSSALMKEVGKLAEGINAGIHALQSQEGGPGEEGVVVVDALLIIDENLKSARADLQDALEVCSARAKSAEDGLAQREVENEAGSPGRGSPFEFGAASTPRENEPAPDAHRHAREPSGGFQRKGALAGGAKPTAAEVIRKRDDKKRRLEEKRVLRETFEGVGQGRAGAQVAGEETPLVDEIFELALRFREGSLPWSAKILGIPVTADLERARKQYRQRAREFHPDATSHPRATEAFHLLQRAWDAFEAYTKGKSS